MRVSHLPRVNTIFCKLLLCFHWRPTSSHGAHKWNACYPKTCILWRHYQQDLLLWHSLLAGMASQLWMTGQCSLNLLLGQPNRETRASQSIRNWYIPTFLWCANQQPLWSSQACTLCSDIYSPLAKSLLNAVFHLCWTESCERNQVWSP